MMYAQDVVVNNVSEKDIKHYIEKIKEHEDRRASFNERIDYWSNYKWENSPVGTTNRTTPQKPI